MIPHSTFLIVDDQADYRLLLKNSLSRKFVGAHFLECEDSESAIQGAREPSLTAALVRQSRDADGLPLLELLRNANPRLPLLLIASTDNRAAAFEAGASAFLGYDFWVRAGSVVEEMLRPQSPTNNPGPERA